MTESREGRRKAVHLAVGGFAFLLRDLTAPQAAGCALLALLFNRFVLPAAAPSLFTAKERGAPWRSGIVLYPAAVLALILMFHEHMDVVAAAWGLMAAGDSAAAVIGRHFGRAPVPWNRTKSLRGMAAFAIAGGLAAWTLLLWMGRGMVEAALLAAPTALFASLVESWPWRLNDNLTVPLLSALFLRGLLEVDAGRIASAGAGLPTVLLIGVPLNYFLAILARRAGTVDRSGMHAGFVVGLVTYACAGWRGFLVLLAFFALGSGTTFLGYRRKARAGIAQSKKGARSARHAFANCGVGVYLAFLVGSAAAPAVFALALVCAYATATFDTVSSEVGQAYGGRPVLITTLRSVRAGTNGAVSWVGTLAGAFAAAAVGGLAAVTGLLPPGLPSLVVVVSAAFLGSTADSLLGATLERHGMMDNEDVNFSNTLIGALAGIGLVSLLSAPV